MRLRLAPVSNAFKQLTRREKAARLLLAACILMTATALAQHFTISAALAGNGDWAEEDRREREQAKREREQQRREREEAKREREAQKAAREEERRQREEEKRQRDEARQQRDQQKQQRDVERAANDEARRQREAERAANDDVRRQQDAGRRNENRRDEARGDEARGNRDLRRDDDRPRVGRSGGGNSNSTGWGGNQNNWSGSSTTQTSGGFSSQHDDDDRAEHHGSNNNNSNGYNNNNSSNDNNQTANQDDDQRTGGDKQNNKADKDGSRDKDKPKTSTASDKPDRTKTSNSSDDDTEREDNAITVEPDEEPRTLVDFVKKLTKTDKPATVNTAKTVKNATPSAPPGYTGVKVRARDNELFDQLNFRPRQLLASGLDRAAASKAEALGFKTLEAIFSPGLSEPVRTLAVPAGMSEAKAQQLLSQTLPNAHFGPNHIYTIVPASDAGAKSYPAARTPEQAGAACAGPECFAKNLIDWKPQLASCAADVRIGIIDTSFDTSHPAFKKLKFEAEDVRQRAIGFKDDWHGTAVLSVLAGDGSSATPGLVPGAKFLLASTFGADSSGQASADAASVLRALAWLDKQRPAIINMSFSGPRNEEIEIAIGAMAAKGVLFVAAAGNNGKDGPPSYPAAYREVIAVTAVAKDKRSYAHATHGNYIDVAAPGVNVYTALPMSQAGLRTGTSFAAPFVTGLLAAMPGARKGVQTKADMLARITMFDLGPPGRDPIFGEGLPVAPQSCNDIGGIAELPWLNSNGNVAQTGLVETPSATPASATGSVESSAASSSMSQAVGFFPH